MSNEHPKQQPISKFEFPAQTLIVDHKGGSRFVSVSDALRHARPGDTIIVRPGIYREQLIIGQRVTIQGDGMATEIIITTQEGAHVIETPGETILQDLSLEWQLSDAERIYGDSPHGVITCLRGKLTLKRCFITGGLSGIHACEETEAFLDNCWISQTGSDGLLATGVKRLLITDSRIDRCHGNGIHMIDTLSATVQDCNIQDNFGWAIYAKDSGLTETCNTLLHNEKGGIEREQTPQFNEDDLPF